MYFLYFNYKTLYIIYSSSSISPPPYIKPDYANINTVFNKAYITPKTLLTPTSVEIQNQTLCAGVQDTSKITLPVISAYLFESADNFLCDTG